MLLTAFRTCTLCWHTTQNIPLSLDYCTKNCVGASKVENPDWPCVESYRSSLSGCPSSLRKICVNKSPSFPFQDPSSSSAYRRSPRFRQKLLSFRTEAMVLPYPRIQNLTSNQDNEKDRYRLIIGLSPMGPSVIESMPTTICR